MEKDIYEPDKLKIENVTRLLIRKRSSFNLTFGTLSNGNTSAEIEVIAIGLKRAFALSEREEEEYEEILAMT